MPITPPSSPQPSQRIKSEIKNSPLSTKERRLAVSKLRQCNQNQLCKALVAAAIDNQRFPDAFNPKLIALQQVYQAFQDNEVERNDFEKKIQAYMKKEGLDLFVTAEIDARAWDENLLFFIAHQLNIDIKANYFVEVAINQGKLYWRIVRDKEKNPDSIIYQRSHCARFDFDQADSWYMTWKQFRAFKDGGKRNSTVEITQERFCNCFDHPYKKQVAARIWQELKEWGILNSRNRLSHAWRSLSNKIIKLDALNPENALVKDDVVNALKELAGSKKSKRVIKQMFVEYWSHKYQLQAGFIYDELKRIGVIGDDDKVGALIFSLKDFYEGIHVDYPDIISAIYTVINDEDNREYLTDNVGEKISGAKIFRPERGKKSWSSSGRVCKAEEENKSHAIRLWDFGAYNELTKYLVQATAGEVERDHIPGKGLLRDEAVKCIGDLCFEANLLQIDIEGLQGQIVEEQKRLASALHIRHTRTAESKIESSVIKQLEEQIAAKHKEKEAIDLKVHQIQLEINYQKKDYGDLWLAIAVPKKMHGGTESRGSRADKQRAAAAKQHPFIDSFQHYVAEMKDQLSKCDPANYHEVLNQCIYTLGALRNMFHRYVTKPQAIYSVSDTSQNAGAARPYFIATIPHQLFFSGPTAVGEIDKLFVEEVKTLLKCS